MNYEANVLYVWEVETMDTTTNIARVVGVTWWCDHFVHSLQCYSYYWCFNLQANGSIIETPNY